MTKVVLSRKRSSIEEEVRKEAAIISYGLPDDWPNWGEFLKLFTEKYGLSYKDTNMSSAEETQKFKAKRNNPQGDLGDIGIQFTPIAIQ